MKTRSLKSFLTTKATSQSILSGIEPGDVVTLCSSWVSQFSVWHRLDGRLQGLRARKCVRFHLNVAVAAPFGQAGVSGHAHNGTEVLLCENQLQSYFLGIAKTNLSLSEC